MTVYRIKDWVIHFENNRTRELKEMAWVPIPNKMDGDGYTELVDHDDGAAHFGAWLAIVEVASKCHPRGTLLRENGRPHDAASLGRVTRLPRKVFEDALPRLLAIGWLEAISLEAVQVTPPPQGSAAESQGGAPSRARGERNGTEANRTERNGDDAGDGAAGATASAATPTPTAPATKTPEAAVKIGQTEMAGDEQSAATSAVRVYREVFGHDPPDDGLPLIERDARDLSLWRGICERWKANKNNEYRVGNMLDRYRKDLEAQARPPTAGGSKVAGSMAAVRAVIEEAEEKLRVGRT